jgi:hypothetical protein
MKNFCAYTFSSMRATCRAPLSFLVLLLLIRNFQDDLVALSRILLGFKMNTLEAVR